MRAAVLDAVVDGLAGPGYAVVPDAWPAPSISALHERLDALEHAGSLRAAAVGGGARRALHPAIRGDATHWIEAPGVGPEAALLAGLDALRVALNRTLMLATTTLECHYARYAPGTGYQRHLDTPQGDTSRVVSLVLYLNRDWPADAGGELALSLDDAHSVRVPPVGGTLVAFLSARFWHEVLPARRPRSSITGWLRRSGAFG